MYTIAETEVFSRYVSDYWTEEERAAFAVWIAEHFDMGDIIQDQAAAEKCAGHAKEKVKAAVYA